MTDSKIEVWLEQCHSNEPTLQVEAIQALVRLGAYESGPAVVEALESRDTMVRATAASALGALGVKDSEMAGAALLSVLNDPEAIVRSEAADALGILGYEPAADPVKRLLVHDPEPLVRAAAAETLGDLGDSNALAELELALRDADESVRGYAANSIGLLGGPQLLPKLQSYAGSEQSGRVKAEFHGARYRLGAGEDLDALLKLLDDADEITGANILNVLNDLTSRKLPATLAADAPRIRTSVTAFAQRVPLLSADAEQVLARLGKADPIQ